MEKTITKDIAKEQNDISDLRQHKVVKSNDLIQKSRFNLSVQEQKIVLYLVSKIKHGDMELKETAFEIKEFCKVCGIHCESGKNYDNVKNAIKTLSDKSMWISLDGESEILLRWINKAVINKKSGRIILRIDEDLKPYLLHLHNNFTQYELYYTLAMKSQYSIRIYELLRSYEYENKYKRRCKIIFDIEILKKQLFAEKYTRFPDFKRNVIDIAMREINEFSDISVTYEAEKDGRRYAKIAFTIKLKKGFMERLETWSKIEKAISTKIPTK